MDDELGAVVVAVPEAESLVGRWRAELDDSAGWGVPAHVTVLFPFLHPSTIGDDVLTALGECAGATPAFTVTFARTSWFGDDVLWLAPEPVDPFVALTRAVSSRFGIQPYGGAYDEPVPHLTVGHDRPVELLREAAADLAAGMPLTARITHVRLIAGRRAAGGWSTRAEFALGGVRP